MNRFLSIALAATSSLLCASVSSAAYSGLFVEEITDFTDVWPPAVHEYYKSEKLTVYHVYAEALFPIDITAIVGTPDSPMYLAGDVFNSFTEVNLGPPSPFLAFQDALVMLDSWFTINDGNNVLIDPVLGEQTFEDGWGTSNGGYFTPPGSTGIGAHTMLFQITLLPGKSAELQFNVHVQGEGLYAEHLVLNSTHVPGPGVLWMIGVAGLLLRRQR